MACACQRNGSTRISSQHAAAGSGDDNSIIDQADLRLVNTVEHLLHETQRTVPSVNFIFKAFHVNSATSYCMQYLDLHLNCRRISC